MEGRVRSSRRGLIRGGVWKESVRGWEGVNRGVDGGEELGGNRSGLLRG